MKKIELAGAFTILGVLLVSQLWSDAHDNMDMPANEAGAEGPVLGTTTAIAPHMATATLAVTGMT